MEDFRKSAPAPLAPISFNIPQPFETQLENGLKVVILEQHKLPLVSFRLFFRVGDIHDPADAIGLNSALAAMLAEGTEKFSSRELAEEVERLGAGINSGSGSDTTSVAASALSIYASKILEMMAEMVLRPSFPEDELDLFRRNTIESLKFQRSQAGFLADEQTARIIFGSHPYSRVSPSAEDIEKISRDRLFEYHQRTFIPNNAVFVAVGDIRKDDFIAELNAVFGDWKPGEVRNYAFDAPPPRMGRTVTIVDRKGSAQANIVLANPAIERSHPDYFSVLVMNQILGAGASSRIFMNLREEKGYTYGAYSKFDMRRLTGAFEATAEVRTAVTGESLKEFFFELNRISDESVSADELADAKNYLTGVFPLRAETQEGLTSYIVQQQNYELPGDYLLTYRDKISAVTIEHVAAAAKKYVRPDEMALVLVGDAAEILPQAREYSTDIELFDTEGTLLDISEYLKPIEEPTVDLSGEWALKIDFQGQQIPVGLALTQAGAEISGKLESMLGEGKIDSGKVAGKEFTAIATTLLGGNPVEMVISGSLDGDGMTGTLSAPMIPLPLEFSGTRKA